MFTGSEFPTSGANSPGPAQDSQASDYKAARLKRGRPFCTSVRSQASASAQINGRAGLFFKSYPAISARRLRLRIWKILFFQRITTLLHVRDVLRYPRDPVSRA